MRSQNLLFILGLLILNLIQLGGGNISTEINTDKKSENLGLYPGLYPDLMKKIQTRMNTRVPIQTQIEGQKISFGNEYTRIVFNGPDLVSMKLDGNGTTQYGTEWLAQVSGLGSGYQWFLNDTWLQSVSWASEWQNLTTSSGFDGYYLLNYTLGNRINGSLGVKIDNSRLIFDFEFRPLQQITAIKNGWRWVINQPTAGYTPEIIDMMWGWAGGKAKSAMTMHQNKRRDFMYVWGMMDKYFYQGTAQAGASINFSVPPSDQIHLFLNESGYLGVVTWPWGRHIGGESWNVSAGSVIDREYTIDICPTKNWLENGPAEFPRFTVETDVEIGTGTDVMDYGAAVTRLLWERAYTYGAPSDGNWIDWGSTEYAWNNPLYLKDLIYNIENMIISPEGHPCSWGPLDGWPFPDNDSDMYNTNFYDTRHTTTNPNYLTAIWRVWQWTTNDTWLLNLKPKIYNVTNFMLDMLLTADEVNNAERVANIQNAPGAVPLPREAEGLYFVDWVGHHGGSGGIGNNYWDIEPFGWLDSFTNALTYSALLSLADFEDHWGNSSGAAMYRAKADRLRTAYSAVFWDDLFGRFIGNIDAWGVRHDYGFTFINQQAAYYGLEWGQPLINITQAYRMYDWMENEPTSSGSKDTFSKWIYAARANTDINHRYAVNRTVDQDWWVAQGQFLEEGTTTSSPWPWSGINGQLQNGGCSVYTSYHDLMARVGFISSDNAEQRLREILNRFVLPDHICGGTPLYLGEVPQQESSGSVGTDYPFPESGMVPTVMIYGILGANPRWKVADAMKGLPAGHVLVLNPTLPTAWNGLSAKGLLFANTTINIMLNTTHIRIEFPSSTIGGNLQVELNGTRSLISSLIDGNGVVTLAYNVRAAEKQKRYDDAVKEYTHRNAIGQTIDINNTQNLQTVPATSTTDFYRILAMWWNNTIHLMTTAEYTALKTELTRLQEVTDGISTWTRAGQVSYHYMQLQCREGEDSAVRGDLRWQVANYRQAEVIANRIKREDLQRIPTAILQVVILPITIGVTVVYLIKRRPKGPKTNQTTIGGAK